MATTVATPAPAAAPSTAAAAITAAANASYASASLYIGDIHPDVTEALLFEIFNAVGPVASVRVCRDAATRRSLGYAYCNFHRVEDAERALDTMNFKSIRGKPCRIMWSHRDPSLRKSGLGNIFVKNLDKTIDNKTLYDTFSMFGNILSCKVATKKGGESLGYGFVHYESDDSAATAIQRVNGKIIAGEKVIVAPFKSKRERGNTATGTFTNIYVKNIPEDASQESIDALFAKHGTVTSSMLATEDDGKMKGFGFINFDDAEAASAAVDALNGHEINGKKLTVCRAQKKDEREKELRDKFEKIKQERQKKYEGVNLYVKNLSDQIDDEKLREEFKQFGTITSVKVMYDSNSKTKGFGFVCFSTPEEATKALTEMNGRMFDAKPLYVALAQRKDVRRNQLEAQYQNISKVGVAQPQMYPPQGQPMFYSPGMPPRNFIYPQQIIPRRWPSGPGGPPQMMVSMGGPRPAGYQLMPVNGRNPQMQGGAQVARGMNGNIRGARGSRAGLAQGQQAPQGKGAPRRTVPGQQGVRYTDNVRNQNRGDQQTADEVSGAEPSPVVPDAAGSDSDAPLTISMLASAPEEQKKQMIGERLFPLIKSIEPTLAGKITGMLLEMDNGELIHLIESKEALQEKVAEAITVLNEHE